MTYTVEFDRIHYPLPLPYMGKPDPRALQETIRQQRAEIKALRQQVVIFRFHVFPWFLSTPDPKGSCCRNHRKLITFESTPLKLLNHFEPKYGGMDLKWSSFRMISDRSTCLQYGRHY